VGVFVWIQQKEYIAVGAQLALLRKQAGLTQQEVARRLRKPQSFVSSYERGQRRVDVLELFRIAEALGTGALDVIKHISSSALTKRR
jgi:transcriptional regulator with XRE-family HTH domain